MGVAILVATSCYRNRNKLWQLWATQLQGFTSHGWKFCTLFCREALRDIFDRCDLDGNGYLSREEFDFFQMKSGSEQCDDDAWEVMKGMWVIDQVWGQDGWILAKFFFGGRGCLWTKMKWRAINTQKRTRPISSHLDWTSLVNKEFVLLYRMKCRKMVRSGVEIVCRCWTVLSWDTCQLAV